VNTKEICLRDERKSLLLLAKTSEANAMIFHIPAVMFLAVVTTNAIGLLGSGQGNETRDEVIHVRDSFRLPRLGFVAPVSSAPAAEDWSEFSYPEQGFAARFPIPPKTEQQVLGDADNKYTQYMFVADQGSHAYLLAVFEYKPGVVPSAPDDAYFTRLINAYAGGSNTTLRKKYSRTIAGHSGVEAIADDANGEHTHLLGVIAVGDRVYLAASIGPHGHEASPEAARFRDSFRLL
jgi:hypothetical protein